ncbi:mitochondrial sodium/calcium exchanger protein [Aplysia californica]|uniref:Mitochondrial sodium/calcium exchanger protein n=1 Tax=Aplysia californica TaxID=6500 RepID=A0ABM1AFP1_APLCA|nr:mitochondrial sodium/calcium exchanger protein [Aplysia californica]
MGDSDNGPDCSDLHSIPNLTDFCAFVRNTSSCDIDEGFINYTAFLYCTLDNLVIEVACLILFIWWFFLFTGLAVTADDFFCPSLAVISQSLKLSHNVAGVTFLAFGNGAPDIFSAIAAIGNAKAGDAGLAIGALFGAGVFVTAVVAGSIAIICPFTSMERPFLRDVIFYLAATFWAWYVMWDKKITQVEAAGFIGLYVVYVIVVILGRAINQRLKKIRTGSQMGRLLEESLTSSEVERDESQPLMSSINRRVSPSVQIEQDPGESNVESIGDRGLWRAFLDDVNPIDVEGWREKRIFGKVFECFKCPLMLVLNFTVPVVGEHNESEPNDPRNWNRLLNSLQVFTGPVFACFATKLGLNWIGGVFPVYALVMVVCAILAALVFFTSKTDERPPYHTAFAYLGFVVAVVWIYSIANEIVNILQAFGIVFDLSDAILGLTLLAWGNSIGDLVADMSLARQGYPRMGISACFGGPLFNLLIGLGVPFTIACLQKDGVFHLAVTLEEMVLAAGLGTSLIATLLIVPLSGFKMSRPYGIALVCLYVAFLVIAILTETNVIPNSNL